MSDAIKSQGTTVEISNEDADLTAYASATFVEVGEVTDVGEPSGEANDIDVTHLKSTAKEYVIGLPEEGSISFGGNFLPDDAGQNLLETAKYDQTRHWLRVAFSEGTIRYAKVLVKKYAPSAAVDGKVPFSAAARISGRWTTV